MCFVDRLCDSDVSCIFSSLSAVCFQLDAYACALATCILWFFSFFPHFFIVATRPFVVSFVFIAVFDSAAVPVGCAFHIFPFSLSTHAAICHP